MFEWNEGKIINGKGREERRRKVFISPLFGTEKKFINITCVILFGRGE